MRPCLSFRVTSALLMTFVLFIHAVPARGENTASEKILPSTAWVVTISGSQFSTGTGCLIDRERRLLITCSHVVKDQPKATVYFPILSRRGEVVTEAKEYLGGGAGIVAHVLATDSKRDLAILQ